MEKQKLKKILFLVLVFVFSNTSVVYAADSKYQIKTELVVSKDLSTTVKKTVTVKNADNSATPESLVLPNRYPADSITAKYLNSDGKPNVAIDQNGNIAISKIKSFKGKNKTWGIVLEFNSDAGSRLGDTTVFEHLPLDYGNLNVSEEFQVSLPITFSSPMVRGSDPDKVTISLGSQLINWKSDTTINERFGVVVGEKTTAEVNYSNEVKNDSWWWQDVVMVLAPENNQQSVYVQSIDPLPSSVSLDVDGNVIAKYRLAPRSSVEVKAKVLVESKNQNYALSKSSDSSAPENITSRYLAREGVWQGNEIDFTTDKTDSISKIKDLIAVLNQQELSGSEFEQSLTLSNLAIGELREINLPARLVLGKFIDLGQETNRAWVEVYAPNIGWVSFDPLMQRSGEHFGFTDARYIALAMRGVTAEYPPIELNNYQLEFGEKDFPQEVNRANVSTTRHHILPGVVLRITNVDLANGRVVDAAKVSLGEKELALGSLAPYQSVALKEVNIFKSGGLDTVTFSSSTIEANGEITDNYLPLILILTVGLASLGYYLYRRRTTPKKEKAKHKVEFASEDVGDNVEQRDLIAELTPLSVSENNYANTSTAAESLPQDETNYQSVDRMNESIDAPRRKNIAKSPRRLTFIQ